MLLITFAFCNVKKQDFLIFPSGRFTFMNQVLKSFSDLKIILDKCFHLFPVFWKLWDILQEKTSSNLRMCM